jgi:hypothetical protein
MVTQRSKICPNHQHYLASAGAFAVHSKRLQRGSSARRAPVPSGLQQFVPHTIRQLYNRFDDKRRERFSTLTYGATHTALSKRTNLNAVLTRFNNKGQGQQHWAAMVSGRRHRCTVDSTRQHRIWKPPRL